MLKKLIGFMQTEETEATPMLDRFMEVIAGLEFVAILFFIAFIVRLASWGMIW